MLIGYSHRSALLDKKSQPHQNAKKMSDFDVLRFAFT